MILRWCPHSILVNLYVLVTDIPLGASFVAQTVKKSACNAGELD